MSKRAELRRNEKQAEKSKVTYKLTKEQLDLMVEDLVEKKVGEKLREIKEEATRDGANEALILLLTLPMTVLKDHYWKKSYPKRLSEFIDRVLEYHEKWENGEFDMEQARQDLWDYCDIRLEYGDEKEKED